MKYFSITSSYLLHYYAFVKMLSTPCAVSFFTFFNWHFLWTQIHLHCMNNLYHKHWFDAFSTPGTSQQALLCLLHFYSAALCCFLLYFIYCACLEKVIFLFCCFQHSVNVAYSCIACVSFINYICILTLLCMHFCFVFYVILCVLLCNKYLFLF